MRHRWHRLPRSASQRNYFFTGAIVSFATLATRNFTTVLALILIVSPVCGLRPSRALRSAFTSLPIPGMVNSPFFLVSFTAVSARNSRNPAVCLLVSSSFSAKWRTSAVFVIPFAICLAPSAFENVVSRIRSPNLHQLRRETAPSFQCEIINVHAGPENCTAIHLHPFQALCQSQSVGFHRFFPGFFGFV